MEFPYKSLGKKLKAARERQKRSVAEASGAIEINEDVYVNIELGNQKPEEDTLMVLLSYLEIKDEEANKIWELAGYDDKTTIQSSTTVELGQQTAIALPNDLRVVYTDMVHVMVNDFGVVMNFLQGVGPNSQPLAIARVGMSKEHAKSVLEILGKSLEKSEQRTKTKQLKSPKKTSDKSDKKDS